MVHTKTAINLEVGDVVLDHFDCSSLVVIRTEKASPVHTRLIMRCAHGSISRINVGNDRRLEFSWQLSAMERERAKFYVVVPVKDGTYSVIDRRNAHVIGSNLDKDTAEDMLLVPDVEATEADEPLTLAEQDDIDLDAWHETRD